MFDIILFFILAITIVAFAASIPDFAELAKERKEANKEGKEK